MEPERATMSFEDKRAAFLQAAEEGSGEHGIVREVEFPAANIAIFLERYEKFKEESRQVELHAD